MRLFALVLTTIAAVALTACAPPPTIDPVAEATEPEEPMVRIRIIYTLDAIDAWTAGAYTVSAAEASPAGMDLPDGSEISLAVDGDNVVLAAGGNELLRAPQIDFDPEDDATMMHIEAVPYGIGWWWEGVEDRSYIGPIRSFVNDQGLLDVVVTLPLEEYLRGVIPQEIGADSPEEALKAQAIAARSDTIIALRTGKYEGPGYDICADVECQVYGGAGKHAPGTDAAIEATRGLVLTYQGEPFSGFYASNCGGHSEDIQNVWPTRSANGEPYWSGYFDAPEPFDYDLRNEADLRRWLEANPDVYCNPAVHDPYPQWAAQNFRWEREFTAEEMAEHAASQQDIGRVLSIEAVERGVSGRAHLVRFTGEDGEFEIGPELPIRQVWTPPLRSAAFVVDTEDDPDGVPERFIISGGGWGHGVGMCQTGAIVRAYQGQDYRQILSAYYRESDVAHY